MTKYVELNNRDFDLFLETTDVLTTKQVIEGFTDNVDTKYLIVGNSDTKRIPPFDPIVQGSKYETVWDGNKLIKSVRIVDVEVRRMECALFSIDSSKMVIEDRFVIIVKTKEGKNERFKDTFNVDAQYKYNIGLIKNEDGISIDASVIK